MYWKITTTDTDETIDGRALAPAGRFVLHRHTDAGGEHLDLRIESDAALYGWRIDGDRFAGACWATEKRPHPKRWLDASGDAETIDAGRYAVERQSEHEAVLLLEGRQGCIRVHAERAAPVSAAALGAMLGAVESAGADMADAARLIQDGAAARQRAVARLCGLGRELDGTSFDETVWRKTLRGLSLDEIHAQLRPFEVRFDRRYPAEPVSRPQRLDHERTDGYTRAMDILRT